MIARVWILGCMAFLLTAAGAESWQASKGKENVPVSPFMADRYHAGLQGAVEAHLDAKNGYRLQAVTVGGRRYGTGSDFPTFHVLDAAGARLAVPPSDPRWKVEARKDSGGEAVKYSANGLAVEMRYLPDRDRLHVAASVLAEGTWKLVKVEGTLLSRTATGAGEYVVDGAGWQVPANGAKAAEVRWDSGDEGTVAAFVGWRELDRIVFVKPLTFSHWLGWNTRPVSKPRANGKPYEESFDSTGEVRPYQGYRGENAKVENDAVDRREGKASLKVTWSSGAQGYGVGGVEKVFAAPVDMTGKELTLWVKTATPETCSFLAVALYDTQDRRVEVRYVLHVTDWRQLAIPVGRRGEWSGFDKSEGGDPTKVSRIHFYGNTLGPNQTAAIQVDDFRELAQPGADGQSEFALQSGLYFRPRDVKNPRTKLCHDALALRIETAGDVNRDGELDWVDAGIAYRERYIKPHKPGCFRHRVRDGFPLLYDLFRTGHYDAAFEGLTGIDFAEGTWVCKGILKFVDEDPESCSFVAKPNPKMAGDFAKHKEAMRRAGQFVGPWYPADYITPASGDWPDEFVRQDPDGKPAGCNNFGPPFHPHIMIDNVRTVASGAAFKYYDQILKACLLGRGDHFYLDLYANKRQGYHPDHPSTPELELQAKHRICQFLHDEKGLVVIAEGMTEGFEDIVDYGLIALEDGSLNPMQAVIFRGSSYHGQHWHQMSKPRPNWSIGLVNGVNYWSWLNEGPAYVWAKHARYYFSECLLWAQLADAKIRDLDRKGARFKLAYDNGAVLEADTEANQSVLTKDGVRYDGFTPFNPKGYMAVLRQDDFEITIPGEHRLEISPNQPHRGQIRFECLPQGGKTVLRGKFGHLKWPMPTLKDGKWALGEADPVLVLRKAR